VSLSTYTIWTHVPQRLDEPLEAYDALVAWVQLRALDPSVSLSEVAKVTGHSVSKLRRWRTSLDWDSRFEGSGLSLGQRLAKLRITDHLLAGFGSDISGLAAKALGASLAQFVAALADGESLTPAQLRQLAHAAEIAQKIQRLDAGQPTTHIQVDGGIMVDEDKVRAMTPEERAALRAAGVKIADDL
jgi:hypothetical protein